MPHSKKPVERRRRSMDKSAKNRQRKIESRYTVGLAPNLASPVASFETEPRSTVETSRSSLLKPSGLERMEQNIQLLGWANLTIKGAKRAGEINDPLLLLPLSTKTILSIDRHLIFVAWVAHRPK